MTTETYPCYVRIGDGTEEEIVEVPTEKDGTMLLSTVTGQFPDAVGLRFKSESGAWRGVRVNGNIMDPPLEGWGEFDYSIVLAKKASKRGADDDDDGDDGPAGKLSKMTPKEILSDMIVLGLPYAATEDDVRKHFEEFGPVEMCEIKYDNDKKSRGFGFIRFRTVEAVEAALDATHILYNRRCELRYPKQDIKDDIPTKLFIGRLPRGTTVEDLREHFSDYGVLKDVYIPNPFRGFGFVTLGSQVDANKVMNSTHVIKGTFVNVSHPSVKRMDMNNPGYGNMQGGMQGNMQGGMQGNMQGGGMQGNMMHGGMQGKMPPSSLMQGNISGGNMPMKGPSQGGPQPGPGYGYGHPGNNPNGNYSSSSYFTSGKTLAGNYGWSGKS